MRREPARCIVTEDCILTFKCNKTWILIGNQTVRKIEKEEVENSREQCTISNMIESFTKYNPRHKYWKIVTEICTFVRDR